MALETATAKKIVKKYGKDENDTGSSEVQVALLTERIKQISGHLKDHKHDHHTTYGLLKLVGQRRRLLRYIQRQDVEVYRTLIKKLGIRK